MLFEGSNDITFGSQIDYNNNTNKYLQNDPGFPANQEHNVN